MRQSTRDLIDLRPLGRPVLAAIGMMAAPAAWARPLGRPEDLSVDGHRIDGLLDFGNVAIVVLFLLMAGWLFGAVLLHRDKKHEAVYEHGNGPRSGLLAICIAAFVFFVVDGVFFTKSFIDMGEVFWNFKAIDKDPETVRIEINAHQWAWDARYAGADGKFNTKDDIVTLNDIRVPVNQPILVQLASTDVIHNLYIPNMRVKQDAVPGSITQAYFKPAKTGTFEIACAQHCGAWHYKMRAQLTVLSKEDFQRWTADRSKDAEQIFNAEDKEAQWGWPWQTHGES